MKRFAAGLTVIMSMASCRPAKHENAGHVVLPDPKLLGCMVLQRPLADTNVPYPKQVSIDFDQASGRGVMAVYDKSVSIDELKLAIDDRYGKMSLARHRNVSGEALAG